jgi:hypothetical protein
MATAIALKAHVDSSPAGWNYAAGESKAHPIAAVKVAFEKNDFTEAVGIDPFLACSVFGEKSAQIAELLEVNERLLPVRVLNAVEHCEWTSAAALISSLDIRKIEVRATALAFAIAFCEATANANEAAIYADEFEDVMSLELGHFGSLKSTIRAIAEVVRAKTAENADAFPLDRPVLERIRWMIGSASEDLRRRGLELCAKFRLYGLAPDIEHEQIQIPLDVEILLANLSSGF